MPDWRACIRARLSAAGLDADDGIVEELAQHVEDRWAEARARGASDDDAVAAALAELEGDDWAPRRFAPVSARVRPMVPGSASSWTSRLAAPQAALDRLLGDVSTAVRSLRRSPWYVLAAISVTALSVAMLATAFSITDTTLFRPLPYRTSSELVSIAGSFSAYPDQRVPVPPPYIDAWMDAAPQVAFATFFDSVAPFGRLGDLHGPIVRGAYISSDLLDTLGVAPVFGGFLRHEVGDAGGEPAALITYGLWRAHFGGRRDVVGERLEFSLPRNAPAVRVAGVLPEGFVFPADGRQPQLLLAIGALPPFIANSGSFGVVGRVPTHMPETELQRRLDAAAARVAAEAGPARSAYGHVDRAAIVPLDDIIGSRHRTTFATVFAGAVVLVLLACLNLAGLAAARAQERLRDAAVRRALGAGAWTLAREQFTQSLLLAAAGGLLGLACVPILIGVTVRTLPEELFLLREPRPDLRAALFVGGTMVVVAGLVSLWPAAVAVRTRLAHVLGRDGSLVTRGRTEGRLVLAAQIAAGLVLTLGGTFVVGSLLALRAEHPGYDGRGLVIVDARHHSSSSTERRLHVTALADAVRRALAVGTVASFDGPFLERTYSTAVGWEPPEGAHVLCMAGPKIGIGDRFFDVMGIEHRAGRLPAAAELDARAPVVVVSDRMAALCWPGRDPVGESITVGGTPFTVVGVVADARLVAYDESSLGQAYFPHDALPQPSLEIVIAARVSGPMSDAVQGIVMALRDAGLLGSVARVLPAEAALAESVRARRLHAWLSGMFAVSALVIIGAGVLGLTAMTVSRRTRELGVRCAIGATRGDIIRLVLRDQRTPLVIGIGCGLVASWWAVRLVEPYLYGLTAGDLGIWACAVVMVVVVTLLGALVPALRASRLDPVGALRE